MRILLIYPQYAHSNAFDSRAPSMSLFYLAAMLEQGGHRVEILDASLGPITKKGVIYRYGISDEEVEEHLRQKEFDIVGISCSFTARWKYVAHMAALVKKHQPQVPVAVGGLFPTSDWEYCLMQSPDVDCVLLGEAELTFLRIVNNLASGQEIASACQEVDGVVYRKAKQLIYREKKDYNDALDALPFPAWHLANLPEYFKYQRNIFELPTPCLPILSSRSCPNRCTFCNMYLTHGRRWRPRSAENVLAEIDNLMQKFDVHNFYFVDDNFSLNLERAKAICQGIIDRGWKIRYNFHNGLSIKNMDEELITLMKNSGCTSVCLAIESGSERIRNQVYRKGLSTEKIMEVFAWCRKAGIPTIGYFMVGAPGETREDIDASLELMRQLPMSLATVGIYTPYPHTELYDLCQDKGWLVEPDIVEGERVEMFSSMVQTPDFSPEDVSQWQKELYLSFIQYHWPTLIKEFIRPGGVVNKDMVGKFFGMIQSRLHSQKEGTSA